MIKSTVLFSAICALFISIQSNAQPIRFDDMGDANAYIFDNFVGKSNDSQSALLVSGDVTLEAYTVATLNSQNDLALVVNGNLNVDGGDINGLGSVNGNVSIAKTNALRPSNENRNFNQSYFTNLGSALALTSSTSANISGGALQIVGTVSENSLFINTTFDALNSVWGLFTKNIDLGTRLIINVSGDNILLNAKDWLIKNENYQSHSASNVLYNFFEAENITIQGAIYGSILAPSADIIGNGGMVNGQVIANSFSGGSQLNAAAFNVDQATPPQNINPVNAPQILTLFSLAVAIVLIRRHKRI